MLSLGSRLMCGLPLGQFWSIKYLKMRSGCNVYFISCRLPLGSHSSFWDRWHFLCLSSCFFGTLSNWWFFFVSQIYDKGIWSVIICIRLLNISSFVVVIFNPIARHLTTLSCFVLVSLILVVLAILLLSLNSIIMFMFHEGWFVLNT